MPKRKIAPLDDKTLHLEAQVLWNIALVAGQVQNPQPLNEQLKLLRDAHGPMNALLIAGWVLYELAVRVNGLRTQAQQEAELQNGTPTIYGADGRPAAPTRRVITND